MAARDFSLGGPLALVGPLPHNGPLPHLSGPNGTPRERRRETARATGLVVVRREATRMGGGSDLQKLSGGENCLLGMVTGVMAKACNYPFLVWKNTQQQGLPLSTTWTTAKGGFNPLLVYRGLPMACMNLGGTNAVQFGTTGFFQKLLANYGLAQDSVQVGGAFLGGLASGIPCSVWELCMIQQQRFGGSTLGTPARIVQEFGLTDLGRGATMTMGRESMLCGLDWT
jgi:hypothetical protein